MVLTALVLGGIAAAWLAMASWLAWRQRVTFRQAFFLAPIAALWRLDARDLRRAADTSRVIYVVSHQSRLDPALMLSLLPDDTLHILDEESARAAWLEPWRALSRTITFNPEHIFISRRLVRVLRGGGRLCVYMPPDIEPDTRTFRLYRAVARIATRAEASVMPVHVAGARSLPFSLIPRAEAPRRLLPKLTVRALEPATIDELVARGEAQQRTSSGALFGRVEEARADHERALVRAA